ncbi:MAG: aldehyde dehydrogenase family protein [Clostridiales bacterium]|nr:aldehyde dehydrogenase family protein [Clostridiales bacterium]
MNTPNTPKKPEKPEINGIAPELYEIISAQREFFATGKTRDIAFRRQLLLNLRMMIRDNEGLILEALRADLGKSYHEGYLTEIGMIEQEINHTLRYLKVWNSPKTVATPYYLFPSSSKKYYHPRGLVMIFAPWNYPFLLAIQPLISSIAAGNCTIVKLSEHSPRTTRLLCELIDKYFDREYIAAYTDSFEAVKAIRHEPFGLVFYTGGSTVARIISKAAATQLTPVVLELGGKSPCIIDKTANLRLAARRIVCGKLLNAGQTCVAPDYLYIDSSVKEEFIGYVKEYHDKFYQAAPCENKFYPKIINRMHFERLRNYLKDGTILFGGEVNEDTCRISLTLMEKIDRDSKLMSEEIFGPILPVFEFNDINIVINTLRKRPKPLALYLFTKSRDTRDMVLNNLDFGCGCINDTVIQLANPHLPFGGIGESGIGRYHGKAGFDTFSAESSVLLAPSHADLNPFRYPPFDDSYGVLKLIFRYLI